MRKRSLFRVDPEGSPFSWRSTGFTLIELLAVIAIISILSSIVLASLNTARAKARDTRRLSDMKSIEQALWLYYDDNGHFPCSGPQSSTNPNFLQALVSADLLSSNPADPINSGPRFYFYQTFSEGSGCGEYVQLNYDRELVNTPCIFDGNFIRAGAIVPESDPLASHCHAFIPTALPCTDPYLRQESPMDPSCAALAD